MHSEIRTHSGFFILEILLCLALFALLATVCAPLIALCIPSSSTTHARAELSTTIQCAALLDITRIMTELAPHRCTIEYTEKPEKLTINSPEKTVCFAHKRNKLTARIQNKKMGESHSLTLIPNISSTADKKKLLSKKILTPTNTEISITLGDTPDALTALFCINTASTNTNNAS